MRVSMEFLCNFQLQQKMIRLETSTKLKSFDAQPTDIINEFLCERNCILFEKLVAIFLNRKLTRGRKMKFTWNVESCLTFAHGEKERERESLCGSKKITNNKRKTKQQILNKQKKKRETDKNRVKKKKKNRLGVMKSESWKKKHTNTYIRVTRLKSHNWLHMNLFLTSQSLDKCFQLYAHTK